MSSMLHALTSTTFTAATATTAANTSTGTSTTGTSTTGTSTTSTSNAATSAAPAATNDGLGRDAFLKLLVAQLRFQDPMKPADGTAFLTQTAQFSMVEKLDEILKSSTEAATNSASLTATGLVGRTVTYTGDSGVAIKGTVASVRLDRTGPVLVVDGKEVPLANVRSVLQSSSTSVNNVALSETTPPVTNSLTNSTAVSTRKGNQ